MIRKKEIRMDTNIFLKLVIPWFQYKPDVVEQEIKVALETIVCLCNPYVLFKICLILSIAYDHDPQRQTHKQMLFYLVKMGNIGPKRLRIATIFLKDFLELPDYILQVI